MKNAQHWQEVCASLRAEVAAICTLADEQARELNDDENARILAIQGDDATTGELPQAMNALKNAERIETLRNQVLIMQQPRALMVDAQDDDPLARVRVPATYSRANFDRRIFNDVKEAYTLGQFYLASIYKNAKAIEWCKTNGVFNAMTEGTNTKGGFLVPNPLSSNIIRIVEQFGVFRANTRVFPMTADTQAIPRRTSGMTVYYVGENTAITASDLAFDQVLLSAKKPAALAVISSELNEDSIVDIAGLLTMEFGLAMATAEDQAGFNGDNSSTYGGIKGLKNAVGSAGTFTAASGNTAFSTLDLADFHGAKALLPAFAGLMPKWYISSQGYAASMEALQMAAGGNTVVEVANGGQPRFLGSPVVFTQVLPTTLSAQTSTIVAYYGDLSMGCTMGDRRAVSIDSDNSIYFLQDAIAVRCTERYDIVCHNVGDSTNAGCVIALKMAAS